MNSKAYSMLEQLKEYHRGREDYIMPVWMPFLGILIEIIGLILVVVGAFTRLMMSMSEIGTYESETTPEASSPMVMAGLAGLGYVLLIVGSIILIYVAYKWIDRRNQHFERMALFFTTLSDLLTELNFKKASIIKSKVNEMKLKYEKKSAGLYAILLIIPYVSTILLWYIMHFLNSDFANHSRDEKLVFTDLYEELGEAGITLTKRPEEFVLVPKRNTILYIVLTIITLGLFQLYWLYVTTKDPNEHFISHKVFEAEIIKGLEEYIKRGPTGEAPTEETIL